MMKALSNNFDYYRCKYGKILFHTLHKYKKEKNISQKTEASIDLNK